MAEYANDVLVEPDWLEQHLGDDSIRVVEVDATQPTGRVISLESHRDSEV